MGNESVIAYLNEIVRAQSTFADRYRLDARILAGWSYGELAERSQRQFGIGNRRTEALAQRILALGGIPVAGRSVFPRAAESARELLDDQLRSERAALSGLHNAVTAARMAGDSESCELFETILGEREDQVDWLEGQMYTIHELGIENYLAAQRRGGQGA